jgi:hypothetical protein
MSGVEQKCASPAIASAASGKGKSLLKDNEFLTTGRVMFDAPTENGQVPITTFHWRKIGAQYADLNHLLRESYSMAVFVHSFLKIEFLFCCFQTARMHIGGRPLKKIKGGVASDSHCSCIISTSTHFSLLILI